MLATCAASSYVQSLLPDKDELANLSAPLSRELWLQHLLTESRSDAAEPQADTTVVVGHSGGDEHGVPGSA